MKAKTNSPFLNYVLSIGFVAFLIVLLVTIVVISRFVLSDVNPLGQHVQNTKDLLDDVSEVQKAAELKIDNQTKSIRPIITHDSKVPEFNMIGAKILDLHHLNVNENKSILSLAFDREIFIEENIYYFKIKNLTELHNREILLYKQNSEILEGEFIALNENGEVIIENQEKDSVKVDPMDLLGRVFYIKE